MNIAPLQQGGSNYSPMLAYYRKSDFRTTVGASFRMVLDVGDWDNSRAINSPGQSGDPFSPHYRDLVPLWTSGDYFPIVYTREAVEIAASQVLKLSPGE
nr:penicillin acylase family protein [Sinorhizobium meliloti]